MSEPQTRADIEALMRNKAAQEPEFKAKLLSDPKAAFQEETGVDLPESIELSVLEETPSHFYLVLPVSPEESEELSDEALEAVAGGGGSIIHRSLVACW